MALAVMLSKAKLLFHEGDPFHPLFVGGVIECKVQGLCKRTSESVLTYKASAAKTRHFVSRLVQASKSSLTLSKLRF